MRNILSIIKYDFKSQKVQIIIEMGILLFCVLQSLSGFSWFPSEFKFIPLIAIFLLINLIIVVVKYIKGISSEDGRLLFMAPIKGWEFVLGKYIEYVGLGIIIVLFSILGTAISGGTWSLVVISGFGMVVGFTMFMILITSFVTIYNSYFHQKAITVILTIVSLVGYGVVVSIIQILGYFIFPRVYMLIGNFIEINVFESIIELLAIGLIGYLSIYHIDKKLDII